MLWKSASFRQSVVLVSLMAVGFLSGRLLNHPSDKPTSTPDQKPQNPRNQPGSARSSATASNQKAKAVPLDLRSTDTLDDLLALTPEDLYERLALWLVDASTEDMAAYWNATKDRDEASSRIRDLFFVRWTLHDPLGAIQAAAGTSSSHIPWWAWGKNDPSGAFQYALAHDQSRIDIVLRAIGQSDPHLARKLLKQHPDLPEDTGLDGILFGLTRDDPEAAVKLASQKPHNYDHRPMQAWIRKDPHAAFDWYLANRSFASPFSPNRDEEIIKTLSAENPELLDEFASKLPQGAFRRKIEAAAFDQLVQKDLNKALEQARKNPTPIIATEQRSKIALHLIESDPQQAKALFAEILAERPDLLNHETTTHYPNGSSGSQNFLKNTKPLLNRLVAIDPQGTVQQLIDSNPSESPNQAIQEAASQWVAMDRDGFAAWTERQTQPSIRDQSYTILISHLSESNEFESAMAHTTHLNEMWRESHQRNILREWRQNNPTAAAAWAEANGIKLETP